MVSMRSGIPSKFLRRLAEQQSWIFVELIMRTFNTSFLDTFIELVQNLMKRIKYK